MFRRFCAAVATSREGHRSPRSDREDKVQPTHGLKKKASSHCSLMTSKGNSRANGISERESNNQPDCEDDQGIGHTSIELLVSLGPSRVPGRCYSSSPLMPSPPAEKATARHN